MTRTAGMFRTASVTDANDATRWARRAQPLLGTLVEVGVRAEGLVKCAAIDAAFAAVREVSARLSRFDATSDIARFNALPRGGWLRVHAHTRRVLDAAERLHRSSGGAFDISVGTAPHGWHREGDALHKLDGAARIDLGGIGKGHAVDCAVRALQEHGIRAGWVNAGGDLRAFGDAVLPVRLRDETSGGVRPFALLHDGAFATSAFAGRRGCRSGRSQLAGLAAAPRAHCHVSVAAPLCLWADALTKVVALSGDASHPLLALHDACAWLH